jgi:LacI family transcriptional regulator
MEQTAEILRRLRAGEPVGIAEVARRARVSIATVSRVMNGVSRKASAETVERVLRAADELGYRPAHPGRALRTRQTRLIALLIPDLTNAFYAAIAKSIEASLAQQDYAMILCNTDEDPAAQDRYLAEMQAHRVRGIALLGAVATPGLALAMRRDTPVVFVNRKSPSGPGIFVGIDNYAAGQAVARHFLEQGYTECAAIHGPLWSTASRARFEGYRDALKAAGRKLKPCHTLEAALTMEDGLWAARRMLGCSPRPQAVFCGNDQIAYGVFRHCRELSLRVPDDIALFGFDDNPLNEWLAPWLSTIHVPSHDFGPAVLLAFKQLWEPQEGQPVRDILLDYSMMLRGSA